MPRSKAEISAVIKKTEKMRSVSKEIKAICRDIVKRSRKVAREDTGRLKRSIDYVIDLEGNPKFTEVYYGQFGDNSELAENIKKLMPKGVKWNLIYTDENGQPFQVIRSSSTGRVSVTNATKATNKSLRKSIGIGGIRNFLNRLKDGKEKTEE